MKKHIMSLHLLGLGAMAGVTLLPTAPAMALNSWDLLSRSIPASACEVRNSQDAARVELVQGAWRFQGAQTGLVTLSCPLPITAFPADHDLGFGNSAMDFYRVWYRDSDGPGAAARVVVTPYLRMQTGALSNIGLIGGGGGVIPPGVCQFNSNAFPNVGFAVRARDCNHKIQLNALYWFEVTMQRNSSQQSVEFHGIDFHDGSSRPAG
jgi:hypothetical protein